MKKYYICLMALFLTGLLHANTPKNINKPNIIFVMVDDCSAVELSCYATDKHPSGNQTPVIDALADEGTLFQTCWATPLCMPTRSLLMSGKYGYQTGVYGNKLNRPTENFAQVHKPISKTLQENGYETAISGKWHLPGFAAEEQWGWDTYSLLGGYMKPYKKDIVWDGLWFSWKKAADTFYDEAIIGKNKGKYPALYWHGAVIENGELLKSSSETYAPDQNQKFAMDFITKDHKTPFFLYYPMVLPHDPWLGTPDPLNPGQKTKPGFSSLLNRVEYYMDELISTLKKNDLYDNTILVFTGDNATLINGKGSCSEVGVRVPFIVAGGPIKHTGISKELIDYSDIYPTLLDAAGIDVDEVSNLNGKSFYPILANKKYKPKDIIFSYLDNERVVRNKEYMMDGSGGIWKCSEDGNTLDYQLMPEGKQTQKIRDEFLNAIKQYPLPSESVFGKEKIEKVSKNYTWPSPHPSMVKSIKAQDRWIENPRRMQE